MVWNTIQSLCRLLNIYCLITNVVFVWFRNVGYFLYCIYIAKTIRELWSVIQNHPKLCKIFTDPRLLALMKPKAQNTFVWELRYLHAKQELGNRKCQGIDAAWFAKTLKRRRNSTKKITREQHTIFCNINYEIYNVILLLKCDICVLWYADKTVQLFNKRINGQEWRQIQVWFTSQLTSLSVSLSTQEVYKHWKPGSFKNNLSWMRSLV